MGTFAKIDSLLQNALSATAPTIALAVFYRDRLLVERAYGYVDPPTRQQPALNSTLFDLASVTKLYTATAFLMQVARRKIRLDDPVVGIIPEFAGDGPRAIEGGQNPHTLEREPVALDVDPTQQVDPKRITFRHLLTHTSGLAPWRDLFRNVGPVPFPPGQTDPLPRPERIRKALALIANYSFVDVPDKSVRYSDLGLILLGEAAARLEDQASIADVILSHILIPAELKTTMFNPPDMERCAPTELDQRWRGRRCQGEVHDENACALDGIAGHAGLFSTAREVAEFGRLWLEAVKGRAEEWLPTQLAREAVQEQTAGNFRGLGWVLKSPAGSSAGNLFSASSFGHTGFTGTSLWIDPERELVTALLTNRVYFGRENERINELRPALHDAVCEWVDALG